MDLQSQNRDYSARKRFVSRLKRLGAWLRNLTAAEHGAVAVEFVIWLPLFLVIMAMTADACKLYLTQANMWDVARDTARRMSTGQYCTAQTAQTYASSQLLYSSLSYTVTVTPGTSSDTVEISTPIAGASVFGLLSAWGNFNNQALDAKVTMPAEPGICA